MLLKTMMGIQKALEGKNEEPKRECARQLMEEAERRDVVINKMMKNV